MEIYKRWRFCLYIVIGIILILMFWITTDEGISYIHKNRMNNETKMGIYTYTGIITEIKQSLDQNQTPVYTITINNHNIYTITSSLKDTVTIGDDVELTIKNNEIQSITRIQKGDNSQ